MNKKTPIAIMLVGLPGSGKSTYTAPLLSNGFTLISSDAYIEAVAAQQGKTYSEVFQGTIKAAGDYMHSQLRQAIAAKEPIIWDQTNLTAKSRASKIQQLLQAGYEVDAIAFEIPPAELERRRVKRAAETGKTIASHILVSMAKTYERPTKEEGFNKVSVIKG